MKQPSRPMSREDGFAMATGLLVGVLAASLGAATLLYTNNDLKSTGHFKRSKQAMAASESAALHALGTINHRMVTNFQTEIVDQWDSDTDLLGSQTQAMGSGYEYSVDVEADPGNPEGIGIIIARATSREHDERSGVRVRVMRRFSFEWGAVYLADPNVSGDFAGNAFEIDGTNYRAFADEPAGDGLEVPGIGTRSRTATENLRGALGDPQTDNIRGRGPEPSIVTAGGPSTEDLDAIRDALLAQGNYTQYQPNGGGNLAGNLSNDYVMGSPGAPQVSYVTGARRITGDIEGSGILLIDGDIELTGNFTWTGWVVVTGSLKVGGNADVQGTVWSEGLSAQGNGSMSVRFCVECLQLANSPITLDRLPSKVSAIGWEELPWDEL